MGLNTRGITHRARSIMFERRSEVAKLRLAGVRELREIVAILRARNIPASVTTIQRDVLVLDKMYQETAAQDIAKAKGLDLERIEELIATIWPAAREGDLKTIDRVIVLLDRRARLLGMDAPTKIDITQRLREIAENAGLDPDEAVAEASRIVASRR